MSNHTNAVIYYDDGRGLFRPVWDKWIEAYLSHSKIKDLLVVTQVPRDDAMQASIPVVKGATYLFVNVTPSTHLIKSAMDIKEVLMLEAALSRMESILIMDADAIMLSDPWPKLQAYPSSCGMVMGEDPSGRVFLGPSGTVIKERNAGVVYFPAAAPWGRKSLRGEYEHAFRLASSQCNKMAQLDGQRAWSLVHHNMRGPFLCRSMNWSHWWGPNRYAHIYHFHGREGKRKLLGNYLGIHNHAEPASSSS